MVATSSTLDFLRSRLRLECDNTRLSTRAATYFLFATSTGIYSHTNYRNSKSLQRNPPISHTRFGASQWATVIAQVAAAEAVVTTTAIVTKTPDTTGRAIATVTTANISNTINTLPLPRRITTIRARRLAPRPTALQDRHRRTMTNLETPAEVASHSEVPLLADRPIDLSRTSLSTPLARGHRTASHPSLRAPLTTDLEGSTEMVDDPAMKGVEEVRTLHVVEEATAALARSRHTIAPF